MLVRIKKNMINNKNILKNISYLSVFQLVVCVLPLVTYPYLIRVLGMEIYGIVIFAQAVMAYFSILIDFGFRNSGVKYIANCKGHLLKISEVISSLLIIKIIFWLLELLFLAIFLFVFNIGGDYRILYFFSFFLTLNDLIFPQFYFLGIQKMKYITLINVFIRVSFIFFIFIFIKSPSDYIYVPLLNAMGIFLGGMSSLYIIFRKHKVIFFFPSKLRLKFYLKDSVTLFLSDVVISIKDKFTVVFLGLSLGMHEVAIYDLGLKIGGLLTKPFEIINTVILPIMSANKNLIFLLKSIKIIFIVTLIMCFLSYFALPYAVPFLLNSDCKNLDFTPLRIMMLFPLFLSISYTLATNFFIVFNLNKQLLLGMLLTTIFYVLLVSGGYYFKFLDGILSFVVISLFVYVFELFYRVFIFIKVRK